LSGTWFHDLKLRREKPAEAIATRAKTRGIMDMINRQSANWLNLYQAAVLERDIDQMSWRIGLAVEAIDERVRALSKISNGSVEEKRKLDDALNVLGILLKAGLPSAWTGRTPASD
jgi:hypothetical protein